MIEARLEFEAGSLEQVLEQLLSLLGDLRPTHYSFGEDEEGKLIGDPVRFIKSVKNQVPGPYLIGRNCSYDISVSGPKPLVCHAYIPDGPPLAEQFLMHMATAQPIFGFACTKEERYQRNRVIFKQGVNTIESWVGRDTQKYVPGFYWLTLFPAALAKQHGISLSAVAKFACEHVELEGGQHLLRFYDRPEDWQSASTIAELYASLEGVFNIEKVKLQLLNAKNFLEVDAILRAWK
jgi:hypothetical protein